MTPRWHSLNRNQKSCMELRRKLRRSSAAVATSREGHRSPRSGRVIWSDGHYFSTAAQGQLPNPPKDQSQEQNRHPLAYDHSRQAAVIVIHGSSPSWSWSSLLIEHDALIHLDERPLDRRLRQSVPLQYPIIQSHEHFELCERCLPKVLV